MLDIYHADLTRTLRPQSDPSGRDRSHVTGKQTPDSDSDLKLELLAPDVPWALALGVMGQTHPSHPSHPSHHDHHNLMKA